MVQKKITTNAIADNIMSQVDEEGHRQLLLRDIVDHRINDEALKHKDSFYIVGDTKRRKKITIGWQMCVEWKDGSTDWVELKDLKQSYPVELARYARDNKLENEPAFAWWVPFVEKKKSQIISKIKSKYWQRTHKYRIRVPKLVDEAYEEDKRNSNSLWTEAIAEEIEKIRKAITKYKGKSAAELIGYQQIKTHIIFYIKLGENFRRKARLVADSHLTDTPASITYSSVVS